MPRLILNGQIYKEGTFDEGVTLAEFLIHQDAAAKNQGTLLGFTDQNQLLAWAETKGIASEIAFRLKSLKQQRTKFQRMPEQELAQWEIEAKKATNSKQREIKRLLMTEGVDITDIRGLFRLKTEGKLGSLFLCDQTNFGLPWRYTTGNAKLSWDNFNDRAESAINLSSSFYFLFQHTWWRGSCYLVWPCGNPRDLGWFNNRASSVW